MSIVTPSYCAKALTQNRLANSTNSFFMSFLPKKEALRF
jgi:hypothetical protein